MRGVSVIVSTHPACRRTTAAAASARRRRPESLQASRAVAATRPLSVRATSRQRTLVPKGWCVGIRGVGGVFVCVRVVVVRVRVRACVCVYVCGWGGLRGFGASGMVVVRSVCCGKTHRAGFGGLGRLDPGDSGELRLRRCGPSGGGGGGVWRRFCCVLQLLVLVLRRGRLCLRGERQQSAWVVWCGWCMCVHVWEWCVVCV